MFLIAAVAAALAIQPARAALEDDYREGEAAYRRGDVSRAMEVLKKAADGGHAKAQRVYAEILDRSDFDKEAVEYYRKSAAQGEAEGEFGLASMLAAGEGAARDPVEAYNWFVKAGEQGHQQAIRVLANAYLFGELQLDEAARNGPDAAKWIRRAAELDHLPAVEALTKAYTSGGFGIAPEPKEAALWTEKLNKLRPAKPKRK
jgi:hypothetical protein